MFVRIPSICRDCPPEHFGAGPPTKSDASPPPPPPPPPLTTPAPPTSTPPPPNIRVVTTPGNDSQQHPLQLMFCTSNPVAFAYTVIKNVSWFGCSHFPFRAAAKSAGMGVGGGGGGVGD